jgi:hypothetical protein
MTDLPVSARAVGLTINIMDAPLFLPFLSFFLVPFFPLMGLCFFSFLFASFVEPEVPPVPVDRLFHDSIQVPALPSQLNVD